MIVSDELMETMLEHSFKDFHTRGFDYLCIKRTPEHTRKVYFFDGDVSKLPEVVNPHDHRYKFSTTVLSGVMSNSIYLPDIERREGSQVYQEFEYRTPLNGGNGFTWKREAYLFEERRLFYRSNGIYYMEHNAFHTIRMHVDGTVLLLDQFQDILPIDKPTRTFIPERKAPNLDGLYSKFTADEAIKRFQQYLALRSL